MSRISRRTFFRDCSRAAAGFSLAAFSGAAFVSCRKGPAPKLRPNILWIMAEDLSPDIGCYGEKLVQTPHIDELASEGIRFTHAFATSPVCSPSRSAMLTGMFQTSIDAHHHRSHRRDGYTLPAPWRPLTEYLREAGYFTAIGCGYGAKTDLNFSTDEPLFEGKDWTGRDAKQPFFAQITFPVSHRPFRRDAENPIDPDKVALPPYYPDHPLLRRDWADYLESIQLLDRQMGELLVRLEREGLAENTVIIFIGDNGRCHLRGKQWLYEGGIHVPLIVRWPGVTQAGHVADQLLSTIDISASILAIAGLVPPSHLHGQTFLPDPASHPERDFVVSARDRCDETVDRIRSIRTRDFKYIRNFAPERPYLQPNVYKYVRYPALTVMRVLSERGDLSPEQEKFLADSRPREELYDLKSDPQEVLNLVDDPALANVLADHRQRLDRWMEETGDRGAVPETEEEIAFWAQEAEGRLKRFLEERDLPPGVTDEAYLAWWERKLLG